MEGLLIILGELIFLPLIIVLSLLLELILPLFTALPYQLAISQSNDKLKKFAQRHGDFLKKAFKITTLVTIPLAVITTIALLIINSFFLEETVRFFAEKAAKKSDISLQTGTISGNLFKGKLSIKQLKLTRNSGIKDHFDLQIGQVNLDIDITKLFFGQRHFENLELKGLTGDYFHQKAVKSQSKRFVIDNFHCEDSKISLHTPFTEENEPVNVQINSFKSVPLRSHMLLFDLLFRSNIEMSIDYQPIKVVTEKYKDGYKTRWMSDLPCQTIQKLVGSKIFPFPQGMVKVDVKDKWSLQEPIEIDMDWNLTFDKTKIELPNSWPLRYRIMVKPITLWINHRKKPLTLGFSLKINENNFEGDLTPDLEKFFEKHAPELIKALKSCWQKAPAMEK